MPISDCEVRDPRIRRTRALLQGALHRLMQAKSFDEISVQDIAEAATVNRATFYDHYTDKFALLEAMAAGGFHAMLQERNVRFDTGSPAALGAIVRAVGDYLAAAHSSGSCEHQSAFVPLIDAAITSAMRRVLLPGMPPRIGKGVPPEIVATAVSWAIYGAVKQWLLLPERSAPDAMVDVVLDLVLPMLRRAEPIKRRA